MGLIQRLKEIGPGAMVAAAFIGPGTVTTASVTGARFGYALIWTIAFSIIATIILQEMSARLGLVSREGLGEALHDQFDNEFAKWGAIVLVIAAIGVGTAAYEAGNLIGGAAGLATITGVNETIWAVLIAFVSGTLLYTGKYDVIERVLVGLVIIMAIAFVGSAILIGPDLSALAHGFVPKIPQGSLILVTGLIGTTVVGYNLFLHASNVQERWSGSESLTECRIDTIVSITVGGLITMAILVTAAAAFPAGTTISNVGKMAEQLRPIAGPYATILSVSACSQLGSQVRRPPRWRVHTPRQAHLVGTQTSQTHDFE